MDKFIKKSFHYARIDYAISKELVRLWQIFPSIFESMLNTNLFDLYSRIS